MSKPNASFTRNANSLLALRDLLLLIIRQPAPFAENDMLKKALKSQAGIAALEISFEDDGQVKQKERLSVNTLKSHSANVFEQGFEGLDALRIAALDKIEEFNERLNASNKRTKVGLSQRTLELEEQLQYQQRINMVLLQGISHAIGTLRTIRHDVKPLLLEKRAKDQIDALLALLTINPPPFNAPSFDTRAQVNDVQDDIKGNVAELDDYRK